MEKKDDPFAAEDAFDDVDQQDLKATVSSILENSLGEKEDPSEKSLDHSPKKPYNAMEMLCKSYADDQPSSPESTEELLSVQIGGKVPSSSISDHGESAGTIKSTEEGSGMPNKSEISNSNQRQEDNTESTPKIKANTSSKEDNHLSPRNTLSPSNTKASRKSETHKKMEIPEKLYSSPGQKTVNKSETQGDIEEPVSSPGEKTISDSEIHENMRSPKTLTSPAKRVISKSETRRKIKISGETVSLLGKKSVTDSENHASVESPEKVTTPAKRAVGESGTSDDVESSGETVSSPGKKSVTDSEIHTSMESPEKETSPAKRAVGESGTSDDIESSEGTVFSPRKKSVTDSEIHESMESPEKVTSPVKNAVNESGTLDILESSGETLSSPGKKSVTDSEIQESMESPAKVTSPAKRAVGESGTSDDIESSEGTVFSPRKKSVTDSEIHESMESPEKVTSPVKNAFNESGTLDVFESSGETLSSPGKKSVTASEIHESMESPAKVTSPAKRAVSESRTSDYIESSGETVSSPGKRSVTDSETHVSMESPEKVTSPAKRAVGESGISDDIESSGETVSSPGKTSVTDSEIHKSMGSIEEVTSPAKATFNSSETQGEIPGKLVSLPGKECESESRSQGNPKSCGKHVSFDDLLVTEVELRQDETKSTSPRKKNTLPLSKLAEESGVSEMDQKHDVNRSSQMDRNCLSPTKMDYNSEKLESGRSPERFTVSPRNKRGRLLAESVNGTNHHDEMRDEDIGPIPKKRRGRPPLKVEFPTANQDHAISAKIGNECSISNKAKTSKKKVTPQDDAKGKCPPVRRSKVLDEEELRTLFLPEGWQFYASERQHGKGYGKFDLYYITPPPHCKKLRSRTELTLYLEKHGLKYDVLKFFIRHQIAPLLKCGVLKYHESQKYVIPASMTEADMALYLSKPINRFKNAKEGEQDNTPAQTKLKRSTDSKESTKKIESKDHIDWKESVQKTKQTEHENLKESSRKSKHLEHGNLKETTKKSKQSEHENLKESTKKSKQSEHENLKESTRKTKERECEVFRENTRRTRQKEFEDPQDSTSKSKNELEESQGITRKAKTEHEDPRESMRRRSMPRQSVSSKQPPAQTFPLTSPKAERTSPSANARAISPDFVNVKCEDLNLNTPPKRPRGRPKKSNITPVSASLPDSNNTSEERVRIRSKPPRRSPYFSSSFNGSEQIKSLAGMRRDRNSSDAPPRSPYNLIQEDLFHDPWQMLIATIFLNSTSGRIAIPLALEFLKRWPTPQLARQAKVDDILDIIEPLGFGRTRAAIILRFSHEYLTKDWKLPNELYGIGDYGNDSYKIFCMKNAWKKVESDDPMLMMYLNWRRATEHLRKKFVTTGSDKANVDPDDISSNSANTVQSLENAAEKSFPPDTGPSPRKRLRTRVK